MSVSLRYLLSPSRTVPIETLGLVPRAESHVGRSTRDAALRRLLALGDMCAAAASFAMAIALNPARMAAPGAVFLWMLFLFPAQVVAFKLYGLYDRDAKHINHTTVDELPWLMHGIVICVLLAWLDAKLAPVGHIGVRQLAPFFGFMVVSVITARTAIRHASVRILGVESALVVGGGEIASVLIRKLEAHPEYGVRVVGVVGDAREVASAHSLPLVGFVDELEELALRLGVRRVITSPVGIEDHDVKEVVDRCRALGLKVSLLPQLSDVLGASIEIDDVEGLTVLNVNPPWLNRSARALKRTLDLVLATLLLVILAPLMVVVAIAVKLDSAGPVLFTQERVGKGGRRFRLVKFRTMAADAESRRAELLSQSTDPNWLHIADDPRITRLGRHLRRLSLDELPQLWNVLRGEMSMVGPRPLICAEDARVQGSSRRRLDLTPGITGYWQVLGRTRISFEEMVKLDYLYVMNWSLWTDLRLLLRTLPTVLSRRGAN